MVLTREDVPDRVKIAHLDFEMNSCTDPNVREQLQHRRDQLVSLVAINRATELEEDHVRAQAKRARKARTALSRLAHPYAPRAPMVLSPGLAYWVSETSRDTAGAAVDFCGPARSYSTATPPLLLWHQRLGHRNFSDVARLIGEKQPLKPIFCEACVQAKSTRHTLSTSRGSPLHESPRPGYMFHCDTAGPFRVNTRGGNRFLEVKVDDHSRCIFASMESTTGAFCDNFKVFCRRLEAEFGRKGVIARLLADSATYYEKNIALMDFCRQQGIVQLFSPPYTQSLNGVAERAIRTIVEMARAMLMQSGAPAHLYGEAFMYAVYILNRLPRRAGDTKTRLEYWTGRDLPVAHKSVRTWGCAAWVQQVHPTKTPKQDKLLAKATRHILLGVDERRQCYRLGAMPHYQIVHSAHVIFNEEDFPCKSSTATSGDFMPSTLSNPIHTTDEPQQTSDQRPQRPWAPSSAALRAIADGRPSPPNRPQEPLADAAHALGMEMARQACSPEALEALDYVFAVTQDALGPDDPTSYSEAMLRADSPLWRRAITSEYLSHVKNGTFGPHLDHLPPGFKAIPAALILKTKRDGRAKARLVARGYHMQEGRDYNETFAPVAYVTTLRLLFALAAEHNWEIKQGDVATAFLSADMDAEVYVTMPRGFMDHSDSKGVGGEQCAKTYRRMLKGIPGIPQGSYLFNRKVHKIFIDGGLQRAPDDHALYYDSVNKIYMVVWVDDLFLFFPTTSTALAKQLWSHLQQHLDLGEWDDVSDCLACTVRRDRDQRIITLSQTKAIWKFLRKVGMEKCNPADTPVATGFVFTKEDCPSTERERTNLQTMAQEYRSRLAMCIYFGTWTRPDIAYALSKLCKFMHNPGEIHKTALTRMIRYMKKTADIGLVYSFATPPEKLGTYGFYDASHADDVDTLRTTLTYLFYYAGCCISWNSKLHTYVTTSTNHSEYCGAAKAAREAKWLEKMFDTIGFSTAVRPIDLFSDSQGAIAMTYNPVRRSASKHVDLADHYAREQVERGTITVSYVSTNDMIADLLTKALPKTKFDKLRAMMVGDTSNDSQA